MQCIRRLEVRRLTLAGGYTVELSNQSIHLGRRPLPEEQTEYGAFQEMEARSEDDVEWGLIRIRHRL
jgi:hypothetical protein